jgi:segregation and condensation protein B
MRTTEIIEALLFASDAPLSAGDLCRAAEGLDEDAVEQAILALRAEYDATGRAFQIYELAGGYQLLTRPEYAGVLERFHTVPQSGRLSGPALEVLAIIAYRQPIGRAEIEEIRGIGSAGVLRTLQERQLIDVVGRGEGLGRPLLYGTTQKFLDHFGFNSLHDLPRPDELPVVLKQRAPAAAEQDASPAVTEAASSASQAVAAAAEAEPAAAAAADAPGAASNGAGPRGVADERPAAPDGAGSAEAEDQPAAAAGTEPAAAAAPEQGEPGADAPEPALAEERGSARDAPEPVLAEERGSARDAPEPAAAEEEAAVSAIGEPPGGPDGAGLAGAEDRPASAQAGDTEG